MHEERVFIAGAGPVGLVAAAQLVAADIPVTVFEAGSDLSTESRASTFHPSTLDMLEALGVARPLEAQGFSGIGAKSGAVTARNWFRSRRQP